MKLILAPLMFSVACIAYQNRDKIADQFNAAYPANPAKAAALQRCANDVKSFNRLDADDRQYCYRQYVQEPSVDGAGVIPAAVPVTVYPYNPSHLPANDIRRQEANDSYLQERMLAAAASRPVTRIQTSASPQRMTVALPYKTEHHVSPTSLAR
jgi:hypothetical protein